MLRGVAKVQDNPRESLAAVSSALARQNSPPPAPQEAATAPPGHPGSANSLTT